jgi:steroid 5-alpha reductase family enzyme
VSGTLQLCWLAAALLAFFSLVFLLARRLDNYGIVDVAWALCFAPSAAFLATFSSGALQRRLLLSSLVTLWSLRLGLHLWKRVASHHPVEDGRYVSLRKAWSGSLSGKMFLFFMGQALVVLFLCAPLVAPMANVSPDLSALELGAAALFLCAVLGESLADAQLARFKASASNRGRVCDTGLWGLSRHPNYFFEWLIWVAFALFCLASPWGWTGLLAPLLMHHFLHRVTGVVYTEAQLLRSKGAAYAEYQSRVPAFYPFPFRRTQKRSTS